MALNIIKGKLQNSVIYITANFWPLGSIPRSDYKQVTLVASSMWGLGWMGWDIWTNFGYLTSHEAYCLWVGYHFQVIIYTHEDEMIWRCRASPKSKKFDSSENNTQVCSVEACSFEPGMTSTDSWELHTCFGSCKSTEVIWQWIRHFVSALRLLHWSESTTLEQQLLLNFFSF